MVALLYVPFVLLSIVYLYMNRYSKFMRVLYGSFIPTFLLMHLLINCKHDEQQSSFLVKVLVVLVLFSVVLQICFLLFYWQKNKSVI